MAGLFSINSVPRTAATTFAFPAVLFLFYGATHEENEAHIKRPGEHESVHSHSVSDNTYDI